MHLVGSLPWSLMRMMSGLEERLLSQLGLLCSFAEKSMSLDGFLRQQLRVCVVEGATFQG
jgi:hypothetical protein